MQIFIPFNFEVDDSDRLLENAKDTWIDEAVGCTIYVPIFLYVHAGRYIWR